MRVDIDDVRQETALDGIRAGKTNLRLSYRRFKMVVKESRYKQMTDEQANGLVCGRGLATETLIDLEGLDSRTLLVARLLAEGHRDGAVQQMLDMGRREFEVRRQVLRDLYS